MTTFRVRCKRCNKGVVEVTADKLDFALAAGVCRFCGQDPFAGPGGKASEDPLSDLRAVPTALGRFKGAVEVEFDVPVRE